MRNLLILMNLPFQRIFSLVILSIFLFLLLGFITPVFSQQNFIEGTTSRLPSSSDDSEAAEFADIDNDGDLDLVIANGSQNRILVNDGNGVFSDETDSRLPDDNDISFDLAVADFDGDGNTDIFFANAFLNTLLLNDGTGIFVDVTPINLPQDSDISKSVAVGDVDDDGDIDIVIANLGQDRILINTGTGNFSDETAGRLPADDLATESVILVDIDGDNDLDIATAEDNNSQNRILINDGDGTFTDETADRLPIRFERSRGIVALDIDSNNTQDLVVVNFGQRTRVLINNGAGVFADDDSNIVPTAIDPGVDVDAGDLNGDGKLDIVIANGVGAVNRILLSGSNGRYSDVTFTAAPFVEDDSKGILLGDIEGDGDLDIFVANASDQSNRLLVNNQAPVLDEVPDTTIVEGQSLLFTVTASDPDGDELTFDLLGPPPGASFDADGNQQFSWTPGFDQAGTFDFIFIVSDRFGLTDQEAVRIVVEDANRAPVFDQIPDTVIVERQLIEFFVSASDPDDDPLSYGAIDLPQGAQFDPAVRKFSWRPTPDQGGLFTITFTADDGRGGSAQLPVMITVDNTNEIPVFVSIPDISIEEREFVEFTVQASDPDGDTLSLGAINLPSGAQFDSLNTLLFSWRPNVDQGGDFAITFTATDGRGGFASEDVVITVDNTNEFPVIEPIPDTTIVERQLLEFFVIATDPDNDQLTFTTDDLPDGADFDSTGTQLFTWRPRIDQGGIFVLRFNVDDARGGMTTEIVIITVDNSNEVPVFQPIGNKTIQENQLVEFFVVATDGDGDTLTYHAEDLPIGAIFDPASQQFNWTPTLLQAGEYNISFIASDGRDGDGTLIVKITVTDVNRNPTFSPLSDFTISEGELIEFTIVATDPDPDNILTYGTIGSLPPGASFDSTAAQIFSWVPSFLQSGLYVVSFTVNDGAGGADTVSTQISVVDINSPPRLNSIPAQQVRENELLEFTVTATDPDNDEPLTFGAFNLPEGASFDSSGTQLFNWKPSFEHSGVYVVTFTVRDGKDGVDSLDVQITVIDVNRAPASFSLISPANGDTVQTSAIVFEWNESVDPDGDEVHYLLVQSTRADFFRSFVDTVMTTSVTVNSDFTNRSFIYWKVIAVDSKGGVVNNSEGSLSFFLDNAPLDVGIEILQNPVFTNDIDIFFVPTKNLLQLPKVTVNGNFLHVVEIKNNEIPIFVGDFHMPDTGENQFVTISITVTDKSGTDFLRTTTFSGSPILASKGGSVLSSDGGVTLTVDKDAMERDTYILSLRAGALEDASQSGAIIFTRLGKREFTYAVSEIYDFEPASVALSKKAKLVFNYSKIDLADNAPHRLSVYKVANGKSEHAESYIDSDRKTITAFVDALGGYFLGISDAEENGPSMPAAFSLLQNYPNPFNPSTTISFEIPEHERVNLEVKLNIYNVRGQLVKTLMDEEKAPGFYAVHWDGTDERERAVSSGIYYYRIVAGEFIDMKKMLILK